VREAGRSFYFPPYDTSAVFAVVYRYIKSPVEFAIYLLSSSNPAFAKNTSLRHRINAAAKKKRNPLNPLIHIFQRISSSGNPFYIHTSRVNPSIAFNIHHRGLAHWIVPSTFPLFGRICSTTDAWYRKR
jgi:hypothetical protein